VVITPSFYVFGAFKVWLLPAYFLSIPLSTVAPGTIRRICRCGKTQCKTFNGWVLFRFLSKAGFGNLISACFDKRGIHGIAFAGSNV
jgi:hypothetical protein